MSVLSWVTRHRRTWGTPKVAAGCSCCSGEGWQKLAPGQPRAFPCSLLAEFREKECLVWVVILFGLVCVKDESKRRGVPL